MDGHVLLATLCPQQLEWTLPADTSPEAYASSPTGLLASKVLSSAILIAQQCTEFLISQSVSQSVYWSMWLACGGQGVIWLCWMRSCGTYITRCQPCKRSQPLARPLARECSEAPCFVCRCVVWQSDDIGPCLPVHQSGGQHL